MKIPKYKKGDLVTCSDSEEVEQPMEIVGKNTWITNPDVIIYYVKGVHRKKKNELIISLSEERLVSYS